MTAGILFGTMITGNALACPGRSDAAYDPSQQCAEARGEHAATSAGAAAGVKAVDPAHCARKMIGPEACAWTTSMMAQRVLEEGTPWTYVGRLLPVEAPLPSRVAAPFAVGPDGQIHVVANEVLELLERDDAARGRIELTGRLLEVDGIQYFVATALQPASS